VPILIDIRIGRRGTDAAAEIEEREIERRSLNTIGLGGDGPLGVVITPLLVISTDTAYYTVTSTITKTTQAPDVTTTVYVDFPLPSQYWSHEHGLI
jgi:hypothetical protein